MAYQIPQFTMGQTALDFSPLQNALGQVVKSRQFDAKLAQDQSQFEANNKIQRDQLAIQQAAAGRAEAASQREDEVRQRVDAYLSAGNFGDLPPQLIEVARAQRSIEPVREYLLTREKAKVSGGLGNQPIFGTDASGNVVVGRLAPEGLRIAEAPAGFRPDPRNIQKIDTGLGTELRTPAGNVVASVPKDISGSKAAGEVGEARGKFIAALPKLEMAQSTLEAKNKLIDDAITKAEGLLKNPAASGLLGKVARNIPTTDAAALQEVIKTIKANIGFETLQQMRAESPTGGALGQVAVQELEYLQSVLGSLEQAQRPEDIKENLAIVRNFIRNASARRRAAIEYDRQRFGDGAAQPPNLPQFDPGVPEKNQARLPQPGMVQDGYRFKGGDPSRQENWEPVR